MSLRPRPSLDDSIAEETSSPRVASPKKAKAPARERKALGPLRALGWLFVFGLLAVGLLIGALLYRLVMPAPEATETVQVVQPTPDVIVAVRDLARLETASFHVERVIDLRERQQAVFGLMEAEDAILLVAAADVTAGVDLTRMRDGDVVVSPAEGQAEITLPPPEIFFAALDNERTYVHTRETDTLARRNDQLETRARREAERSLRQSAIDGGILTRARANAETAVRTLVRSLGYDEITIRFAEPGEEPAVTDARD